MLPNYTYFSGQCLEDQTLSQHMKMTKNHLKTAINDDLECEVDC